MTEPNEILRLEITSVPPDTAASVRKDVLELIAKALSEESGGRSIAPDDILVETRKPFPTDPLVVVIVSFVTQLALEFFKTVVLPKLKARFVVTKTKTGKRRQGKR